MTASLKVDENAAASEQHQPDAMAVPDQNLLQSVWKEAAPQLARLIGAMGISQGQREDLLQDVYLAAWQKGPPGVSSVQLRRWLVRVTVNRCKLEQRRGSLWRAKWFPLARMWSSRASADETAAASENREDRQFVQHALKKLEPDARSLLVLRYFMELDSAEIGRILERPAATIRGRLRQARQQLAEELKRAGYDHE